MESGINNEVEHSSGINNRNITVETRESIEKLHLIIHGADDVFNNTPQKLLRVWEGFFLFSLWEGIVRLFNIILTIGKNKTKMYIAKTINNKIFFNFIIKPVEEV